MKNKKLIIVGVIALLIGIGGGFFGGMQYQKSKTPNRLAQFGNGMFMNRVGTGNGNQRSGGMNGQAVRGQIISKDDKSITIKMTDGSTKIVILGSSTTIAKTETGSLTDLTTDATVTVFGTTNSDGSITATNVQIGNIPFGPRGSGMPTATPAL